MILKHPPLKKETSLFLRSSQSILYDSLAARTFVHWSAYPHNEWNGYTVDDLKQLIAEIAEVIGLTLEQSQLINIHLADHFIIVSGQQKMFVQAYCGYETDGLGTYNRCQIVINRSKELCEYADVMWKESTVSQQYEYESLDLLHSTVSTQELQCYLLTAWENMVWLLTEELAHAYLYLKAGTEDIFNAWQKKYEQTLVRRNLVTTDFYDCDLSEVLASRYCLTVLQKLCSPHPAGRAAYFQKLFTDSVKLHLHVSPNIALIKDQTYINTGFLPEAYH